MDTDSRKIRGSSRISMTKVLYIVIIYGGDMNEEALIQQIVANFKKLNEEDKVYVLDSLKFIQDNPNLVVLKNEDSQ
tara:strand:- start:198 stop:428 length:231 start_codon:yes stop_codon:yes gene_type:complete